MLEHLVLLVEASGGGGGGGGGRRARAGAAQVVPGGRVVSPVGRPHAAALHALRRADHVDQLAVPRLHVRRRRGTCTTRVRVTIRPGLPGHVLFFGLCPGVRAGYRKSAVSPGFWPNPQIHSNVANCKGVRVKAIRSSDKYTWSQPLAQSSSSLTVHESQDEAGD